MILLPEELRSSGSVFGLIAFTDVLRAAGTRIYLVPVSVFRAGSCWLFIDGWIRSIGCDFWYGVAGVERLREPPVRAENLKIAGGSKTQPQPLAAQLVIGIHIVSRLLVESLEWIS